MAHRSSFVLACSHADAAKHLAGLALEHPDARESTRRHGSPFGITTV
jgi:hypothetical protein